MGEDKRFNEVIRVRKRPNNFVMIDKTFLEDDRLSYKAKGILAYLLSKPDNWKVVVGDLVNRSKDGKASVYAGLRELKEYGYYNKTPVRNEQGTRIVRWESVVYELPISLLTDFQYIENQNIENQFIENRERNNNYINNKLNINNIDNRSMSKKEKVNEKIDYQQVADLYNNICTSLPRIQKLQDKRKKAIKKLLAEYSIEEVKKVFEMAEESLFLKGKIKFNDGQHQNWNATFDWLINLNNFIKVLEGNYKNRNDRGVSDNGQVIEENTGFTETDNEILNAYLRGEFELDMPDMQGLGMDI